MTSSEQDSGLQSPDQRTLIWRAALGLLQGFVLYALAEAAKNCVWPGTEAQVFAPLLLLFALLPPVLIIGVGHLRLGRLLFWSAALGVVVVVMAYHDGWRAAESISINGTCNVYPSPLVSFFSAVFVFIAFALIRAGESDRRWLAAYETYFDTSWKLAVQLQFSALFVGAFWAVLWIGAGLFNLIGLDFLSRLLVKTWFALPATAVAFATALHLTDVRPGMVRSIRNLLLTLQSWLLPLLTLILGGFLASIPFTGLESLWKTRHAASLLLGVSATLVVLINTVYQQGKKGQEVIPVLRYSGRIACGLLLPVVVLAAYAVALRVNQYGLSKDRVIAIACLIVAACYAAGYGWAAISRGEWLAPVALCNVLTSWCVLAVLVALFTPVADPARLAVNSQLAQLGSGYIGAEKFDFAYLRFDTARYGRDALERLSKEGLGADPNRVKELATKALALKNKWERPAPTLAAIDVVTNVHMRTRGATLPKEFAATRWAEISPQKWLLPNCLTSANTTCDGYLLPLSDGNQRELLLVPERGVGAVFIQGADGAWAHVAQLPSSDNCPTLRDALKAGTQRLVAPQFRDIEINGQRVHLQPINSKSELCK
ncbi:MAG TPA: DUF4153 domain-containing protein [Rhodocyclaceae bacterium]|nr:DUF4153 domain-containing protein [Rhodocyclaceae bacterium]